LLGFQFPRLLGMNLGLVINLAYLASGTAALYWGVTSRSLASLRVFCLGLGALYGLVGLVGFVLSWSLALPSVNQVFQVGLGVGFIGAGMVQPQAATLPRAHAVRPGNRA
jgi:hypothetical protein